MDYFDAVDLAHAEFEQRLSLVRDDQRELVTTCPEWTIRDLTKHVVAAARTYTLLLDGCTRERASEELASDALGSDPLEAYRRSVTTLRVAFHEPGALDRACTHPLSTPLAHVC